MSEFVDGRRWPQRAVTPDAPAGSESPSTAPDQQTRPGAPDSIRHLLAQPGVYVQADEDNCQVVIGMDPDTARSIAGHAPSPLQVELAAKLVDGALADVTDEQIQTTRERQITRGLR